MSQEKLKKNADLATDELGDVMASIRVRLNAARRAGDPDAADEAQALYNQAAVLMNLATLGTIREIDDSAEMDRLIDGFEDVTKTLKDEKKKIKKLQATLDKVITGLKVLQKLLGAALKAF